MSDTIIAVEAHEILDSRGNPTIEATIVSKKGIHASAAVPSGASVGTHEALELRDGDTRRYRGQGVLQAVKHAQREIAEVVHGMQLTAKKEIDRAMIKADGTPNKANFGANAILAVSLAVARAAAISENLPLYQYLAKISGEEVGEHFPIPMMNILNGGRHANFIIDFQECMVLPQQHAFHERVRAGSEIFHALGDILKKKGLSTGVGDEGGYAAALNSNAEVFDLLVQATESAGYNPGKDIVFGMDVAASEFYDEKNKIYTLRRDKKNYTAKQLIKMYKKWADEYPIRTIEDGLDEDAWQDWQTMTEELSVTLVGDDLFVTNKERLKKGIAEHVANAILIKVNQIGSLTETLETIALAKKHSYAVAVSHRSGETADTFIADLAVGVGAEYIKTGSLSRSERVEKYNRLMQIEREIVKN